MIGRIDPAPGFGVGIAAIQPAGRDVGQRCRSRELRHEVVVSRRQRAHTDETAIRGEGRDDRFVVLGRAQASFVDDHAEVLDQGKFNRGFALGELGGSGPYRRGDRIWAVRQRWFSGPGDSEGEQKQKGRAAEGVVHAHRVSAVRAQWWRVSQRHAWHGMCTSPVTREVAMSFIVNARIIGNERVVALLTDLAAIGIHRQRVQRRVSAPPMLKENSA